MEGYGTTTGDSQDLVSEIFTKINNAKDKPKKIEILKQYDKPCFKTTIKRLLLIQR